MSLLLPRVRVFLAFRSVLEKILGLITHFKASSQIIHESGAGCDYRYMPLTAEHSALQQRDGPIAQPLIQQAIGLLLISESWVI